MMQEQRPEPAREGASQRGPVAWQIAMSLTAIMCVGMLCVTAILVAWIIS